MQKRTINGTEARCCGHPSQQGSYSLRAGLGRCLTINRQTACSLTSQVREWKGLLGRCNPKQRFTGANPVSGEAS